MAITVGTNSWVTEAEANAFMDNRFGSVDYWTAGVATNQAALITAYNWLQAGRYTFPATSTQDMKDAQCEMALFLMQHQPDLDLRMGLQAQGVVAAGVVKEKYRDDGSLELPLPLIVQQLLASLDDTRPVYLVDLARNPEESVAYDAFANRDTDRAND